MHNVDNEDSNVAASVTAEDDNDFAKEDKDNDHDNNDNNDKSCHHELNIDIFINQNAYEHVIFICKTHLFLNVSRLIEWTNPDYVFACREYMQTSTLSCYAGFNQVLRNWVMKS